MEVMQPQRVLPEDLPFQTNNLSSSPQSDYTSKVIQHVTRDEDIDRPPGGVVNIGLWTLGGADSSTTFVGQFPLEEAFSAIEPELSSAEQIRLVVHTLGFTKRQLGDLFGVSRQAIYDWIKGEAVSDKNASRLFELARMLIPIRAEIRRSLYHRYTTERISADNPSILELLREKNWDTERISGQLQLAGEMTMKRLERPGKSRSQISKSQGDENFLNNLRSLGEG
ncbi:MAG: helix-turn-helix transcriptional regulator [Gammaproteobacteria bacterium]|nr:helix-turn-helix transcriptional regulator [Gammaproteobacteria bacterium]MYH47789.1 helix-turn-helix transcriptional regulator [Gammaproteobacteria bacterium]MYL13465.1 helix-turn-helix transcriptional regulator [Gammaproteobacteria bacterium]